MCIKRMFLLKIILILSFLYCMGGLLYLFIKAEPSSYKHSYSKNRGSRYKGIIYAFSKSMLPWEKESASKHILSYTAGIIFHLGIFASYGYLFVSFFSYQINNYIRIALQSLITISLIAGVSVLVKRLLSKEMRSISCLDDYISNILVLLFLLTSVIHLHKQGFTAIYYIYYIAVIILFIYIPAGKIRHCFFFFITRILFGRYFGRRQVFQ